MVVLGYLQALGRPVEGDHAPGVEHPDSQDRELSRRLASQHRDVVGISKIADPGVPCRLM